MQKRDHDGDEPILTLADAPDAQAKEIIGDGLAAFHEERAGYWERRALAVMAHTADGNTVVGGLLRRTAFGLLFIDVFYLPDTLRGRGIGSRPAVSTSTRSAHAPNRPPRPALPAECCGRSPG